VPLPSF